MTMAGAYLNAMRKLQLIDNALARLDGHTCHIGHTDGDHLRLYQQVIREIESAMERENANEKAATS